MCLKLGYMLVNKIKKEKKTPEKEERGPVLSHHVPKYCKSKSLQIALFSVYVKGRLP